MAFTLYNWSEVSVSLNQGLVSAAIDTPSSDTTTLQGSMNIFSYFTLDDLATVEAADYFVEQVQSLSVNDIIIVTASDGSLFLQVATIVQPSFGVNASVTTQSFTPAGSVGTSNIIDMAVTTAKIADLAVTTAKIANNAVTSAKIDPLLIQYVAVPVSAAQFNGAYAAPKELVAPAGANTLLILQQAQLLMTYNSAAYAAGGVTAIQYDSTVHGAGVIASTTQAAANFQATASRGFVFNAGVNDEVFTTCVNKGLYLSNITGAFTTGDSAFVAHVWYRVIPTV